MDDVVVLKATHDVDDGVHLTDIRQELVPQTFPLAGALHQAGDIDELHPRGDQLLAAAQIRELLQPGIRNRDHTGVRLNGAEGVVGSFSLGIGHQGVEEGRLAHIGQPHDSGFKHRWNLRFAPHDGDPSLTEPPPAPCCQEDW